MRHLIYSAIVLAFAGCTQLPDVAEPSAFQGGGDDYPALIPLDNILAENDAAQEAALRTEQDVAARVSTLRARAARLRNVTFN